MNKTASAEVNDTLIKAASVLRAQQAELEYLRSQLAQRNREQHAEKIASTAVDRGIMEADEANEYAQSLAEGNENLDMVENFLSRTVAGVPLGSSLQKTASVSGASGDDVLTSFLLTSDF
jgi:phosphatidate phosphatase APP1